MDRKSLAEKQKQERLGEERYNNKNELMKIIEYRNSRDIDVQFVESKAVVNSYYSIFKNGMIKNPGGFHIVYNIGNSQNGMQSKHRKEYQCYADMCYRTTLECTQKLPTYKNIEICQEWKDDFINFYNWIINEDNYEKWKQGTRWCLDKDILIKHNKLYSPNTCCLVPNNVNTLFVKKDKNRGKYPIGVIKNHNKYMSLVSNPIDGNTKQYLGNYNTAEEAFYAYKIAKENIIKQVAQMEFDKGNIVEQCYQAMMNYKVEITD